MTKTAFPFSLALLLALSFGCQQTPAVGADTLEMRTVGDSTADSLPVQEPPMIVERATELRTTEQVGPDGKPLKREPATDTDAPIVAPIMMPFAPLIAMDPVDGSKVSIRVETPVTEYKNRLYYFGSAQNKAAFLADPERYSTGSLSRY